MSMYHNDEEYEMVMRHAAIVKELTQSWSSEEISSYNAWVDQS